MTFEEMTSEEFTKKHKYRELEKDFQEWVIELAEYCLYIVIHHPDSRRATAGGWVDLTMVGENHVLLAELKREGEKRSDMQIEIGNRLERAENIGYFATHPAVIPPFRYYIWYPSERDDIQQILMAGREQNMQAAKYSDVWNTRFNEFWKLANFLEKDCAIYSGMMPEVENHFAFVDIMAMGEDAIPLILARIKTKPSFWWFHALIKLTGENPVLPHHAGVVNEMKNSWLQWGIKRGLV